MLVLNKYTKINSNKNIYPSELQLNRANVSDTKATFLDLHLSISNGFVKTKFFDKRDDFDFDVVTFLFLDGVPRHPMVFIFLNLFVIECPVVSMTFITRNKVLTV